MLSVFVSIVLVIKPCSLYYGRVTYVNIQNGPLRVSTNKNKPFCCYYPVLLAQYEMWHISVIHSYGP